MSSRAPDIALFSILQRYANRTTFNNRSALERPRIE
jgi:hypothetical protein